MIVCSCNVLSDQDVRSAVEAGRTRSTSQVYGCLGCSAQCGRCTRTIRRLMDEALGNARAAASNDCAPSSQLCSAAAGAIRLPESRHSESQKKAEFGCHAARLATFLYRFFPFAKRISAGSSAIGGGNPGAEGRAIVPATARSAM